MTIPASVRSAGYTWTRLGRCGSRPVIAPELGRRPSNKGIPPGGSSPVQMALPDDGLVTTGAGAAGAGATGAGTEAGAVCTRICDGNGVGPPVGAIEGGATYAGCAAD